MDYIFETINLSNPSIKHKVWKLFQKDEHNEFLGQDIYDLADNYRLVDELPNGVMKILRRK